MEKFVSYEKLSKKARQRLNAQKRGGWGLCKPVTKFEKSVKQYSRKRKHPGENPDAFVDRFTIIA